MRDLSNLHTFRLPAECFDFVEVTSADNLMTLEPQEPWYLLGEGSNTAFIEDFQGTVIHNALKGVQVDELPEYTRVTVAGGENWHELVSQLRSMDINGLENLALIPGSVGAAPVQNIGAYGVEVSQFIELVTAWDVEKRHWAYFTPSDCEFGYRDSIFKQTPGRWFITEVSFLMPKKWHPVTHYAPLNELPEPVTAQAIFDKVIETRRQKLPDPTVTPNAGSFFKNPVVSIEHLKALEPKLPGVVSYPVSDSSVKLAAGWLIDNLGLKSLSVGNVGVNPKQALVLVNNGQARGAELLALAQEIQDRVYDVTGVELEPEVRLVGAQGLINL